ncbi:hypothetical protein HAX54_033054, partial [Datura stramonium]|nr:hypothetical protein [Datura stramonium]
MEEGVVLKISILGTQRLFFFLRGGMLLNDSRFIQSRIALEPIAAVRKKSISLILGMKEKSLLEEH